MHIHAPGELHVSKGPIDLINIRDPGFGKLIIMNIAAGDVVMIIGDGWSSPRRSERAVSGQLSVGNSYGWRFYYVIHCKSGSIARASQWNINHDMMSA